MKLFFRWAPLALCSLHFAASGSFAGQRYVAPTGSDTASGTFTRPWKTIQHAANLLIPNDTLFIRGGTYAERVTITSSGTSHDSSITLMPFQHEEVILAGTSILLPDILTIADQSYIRILGLKFQDYRVPETTDISRGGAAIRVTGNSQDITLAGNTISDISGVLPLGIAVFGDEANTPIRNIRIVGNTIHSFLTDTVSGSYGGSGIRISGACDSILIRANTIHDMRARYDSLGGAMAITVYGVRAEYPCRRIVIEENTVYDCEPSRSEAITLSGNVEDFSVLNNTVYEVNNIGIATGGGYFVCPDSALDLPRRGQIKGNRVYGCHTRLEDGYAAGIYVDGSSKVIVEGNFSSSNDIGIGVNAEQVGRICDSVIVRSNFVWGNDRAGLAFGGFGIAFQENGVPDTSGIVQYCQFLNNTTFMNNRRGVGQGELSIEDSAFHCDVVGNIFYARDDTLVLSASDVRSQNIYLDYNLWFTPFDQATSVFRMNGYDGPDYTSFAEFRRLTRMDRNSLFASPHFFDTSAVAPNLHLRAGSPAINSGNPTFVAGASEFDIDGEPRVIGSRVDIGGDEFSGPLSSGQESRIHDFVLEQNFPNPFNPETIIRFEIPARDQVLLKVFDLLGRDVVTLLNDVMERGIHQIEFDGSNLASGIYFYQLRAGRFVRTKPMSLIR